MVMHRMQIEIVFLGIKLSIVEEINHYESDIFMELKFSLRL
jgi:hypothetical protein